MTGMDFVLEKAARKERVSREEALQLASNKSVDFFYALGAAALMNKRARFGERATYVVNHTVNPSNICSGGCGFCHYHAEEEDPNAYVMSKEEILDQLVRIRPSEVHITGGLNDHWNFRNSCALISEIHALHPELFIKAYTAVEIGHFAAAAKLSTREVLALLQSAGLRSLTGGGAEIFSERLRQRHCPDKLSPREWLRIHREAHALGIASNATMLYGLGESDGEIVDHFIALRQTQDESRGFSCFIPLAYQPEKGNGADKGPAPLENLRMIALARIILDNFDHIKAYWPMIGLETAAAALSFGADDLDGTLGKERIAHAGDSKNPESLSREMMEETIRSGGFIPVERTGEFKPVGAGNRQ